MGSKNADLILRSAGGLFGANELITIQPEALDPGDALLVWSLFDALEKELIKKRKDVFRDHLLALAKDKGEKNAKGSFIYNPPRSDGRITAQCRKGKASLVPDKTQELLLEKGLFTQLTTGTLKLPSEAFGRIREALAQYEGSVEVEDLIEVIDEMSFSVDEKKLEGAFALDLLTPEDLKSISCEGASTYALTVKKPSVITEMVKGRTG